MIPDIEQEILKAIETKSPNEDENLEILCAILRKKQGTKDQRNAILRVIKQVAPLVVDREARAGIRKAIIKVGIDYKLPNIT
jgi:hypothetical protein